ncbi:MAG: hypothetical protein NTY08_08155 [Proteobacteria bacterium]|nr:hypothetical protein [Pseudomonadota bacterium]
MVKVAARDNSGGRRAIAGRVVITGVLLISWACAAQRSRDEKLDDLAIGAPKAGSKSLPTLTPQETKPAVTLAAPSTTQLPNTDDQLAFVRRNSGTDTPFTDADRQLVNQLPLSPVPGSVTEAAVVLGLTKMVLHPRHQNQVTFQESDIEKGPVAAEPKSLTPQISLEGLCSERGVMLAAAIRDNPLLGSMPVAQQIISALNASPHSPEFEAAITAALRQHMVGWQQLSVVLPAPAVSTPTGIAGPPGSAQVSGPPATGAIPGAASGAEVVPVLGTVPQLLNSSDNALAEAQAMADRGDFRAAVQRAGGIPSSSGVHAKAQDKIKEFSNLGVQDLRRKAAAAFQTAMPISDPKTRAEYLKQAKAFLEDAIKNFPDASQLPTVRENLRVISRDLEKLTG